MTTLRQGNSFRPLTSYGKDCVDALDATWSVVTRETNTIPSLETDKFYDRIILARRSLYKSWSRLFCRSTLLGPPAWRRYSGGGWILSAPRQRRRTRRAPAERGGRTDRVKLWLIENSSREGVGQKIDVVNSFDINKIQLVSSHKFSGITWTSNVGLGEKIYYSA